jgi:hypothetical protein
MAYGRHGCNTAVSLVWLMLLLLPISTFSIWMFWASCISEWSSATSAPTEENQGAALSYMSVVSECMEGDADVKTSGNPFAGWQDPQLDSFNVGHVRRGSK